MTDMEATVRELAKRCRVRVTRLRDGTIELPLTSELLWTFNKQEGWAGVYQILRSWAERHGIPVEED